jgi:hypothetical protein
MACCCSWPTKLIAEFLCVCVQVDVCHYDEALQRYTLLSLAPSGWKVMLSGICSTSWQIRQYGMATAAMCRRCSEQQMKSLYHAFHLLCSKGALLMCWTCM